jgi:hypothetical protein
MDKRLLSAAIALGLCACALPAEARVGHPDNWYMYRSSDAEAERSERAERSDREYGQERTRRRSAARSRGPRTAARSQGRSRHAHRHAGGGASRTCLTSAARALLARIEAQFGRVGIVSTCRPGAVIAGSGRPSRHASGQAIDFNAPSGRKGEVVRWLIANHKAGGIMTYAGMGHIHVDIGPRFVALNSGRG